MDTKKALIGALILCGMSGLATVWYGYQYSQLTHEPVSAPGETTPADQALIKFIVSVYFFLAWLLVIIGFLYADKAFWWWLISYSVSFIALIALIYLWAIVHRQGLLPYKHYIPIKSETAVNEMVNKYGKDRITIPTGFFIEHLSFLSSGDTYYPGLVLSGYMWQRYLLKEHDHLQRGFIFGDGGKTELLRELYRTKTDKEEIICWQFTAILFQRFDVSRFPFDHRHTIIQLLHPEFMNNVILIPDFEGYKNEKQRLGYSNLFHIEHWQIDKSFFAFHIYSYDENFGISHFEQNDFPQLNYYFITERSIIDTVLIYILLLLGALIILFITLLAFLKRKKLTELLGFSTLTIIGVGSSLLFLLISTHAHIRRNLNIAGTAYIEYLFAIVYLAIIGISINSITFTFEQAEGKKSQDLLSYYSDNFIIKILYWPTLLTSMLLVTAYFFY